MTPLIPLGEGNVVDRASPTFHRTPIGLMKIPYLDAQMAVRLLFTYLRI